MSNVENIGTDHSVNSERIEVGLQRSVRYGRIIVTLIVIGAVVGAVASLLFPVREDIETVSYTLGQIVGFMTVVGAAVGLFVGGVLSLLLGLVAKRKHGEALAIHTDYDG